jgi:hypothetical protein
MTVSGNILKNVYTLNESTTVFPYEFKILESSDMEATLYNTLTGESTEVTGFTVVGAGEDSGTRTVTWAGAADYDSDYQLILNSSVAFTQPTDYVENDDFLAETHELALDRLAIQIRQVKEQADRGVLQNITADTSVELPLPEAEKVIGWDEAGTGLQNYSNPAVAEAAAAASAVTATEQAVISTTQAGLANTARIAAQAAQAGAEAAAGSVDFTKDNDGTMADNSDDVVPSQKAVVTYVGAIGAVSQSTLESSNPTNLLSNGGFATWSAGTDEAPDGYELEGTPTIERDTGDVGYGSYSVKITGNGAALEGIKFTTGTLKPSTSYTLSIRVKATAGDTASIKTTGATTNIDEESTSETFETITATFVTDGSGTAVVIKLLAKADTDVVWFDGAMCVEGEIAYPFSPKPAFTAGLGAYETTDASQVGGTGATLVDDTVYQAATDGFVSANFYLDNSRGIQIKTDGNETPSAIRAKAGIPGVSATYGQIFSPVKKGDYWMVEGVSAGTPQSVYWMPLGV